MGPQASRAQRKPAKICRRMGKSQFRKVARIADGSVAHEPPRSTRNLSVRWLKKTSEYSLYGNQWYPGYGVNGEEVHSHTSPIICSHPQGLADDRRRVGVDLLAV